ncbi:MAG: universal stress protein [Deltaproteobacteria bacterium]|nr:universal stress protein [Deltaproteobacteria bacterium]
MKRIMVATDFSNAAFDAAVLAARVARRHGATMLLFHAQAVAEPNTMSSDGPELKAALAESEHLLSELKKRITDAVPVGLTIETVAHLGEPADAIVHEAATWNAHLLAMGSLGAGGATQHPEFGSVAAAVSRRAHCPVLVSRLDQPLTVPDDGAFTKPTVVIDDAAFAHEAVAAAAQLAEPESTIEVVHAAVGGTNDPGTLARMRSEDLQKIAELAPRVEETAIGLTVTAGPSRFLDQLLDFVGTSSDLVVVGAAPPEAGGVLGPIADKMLQRSPVPVAVIPRPALAKPS